MLVLDELLTALYSSGDIISTRLMSVLFVLVHNSENQNKIILTSRSQIPARNDSIGFLDILNNAPKSNTDLAACNRLEKWLEISRGRKDMRKY